MANALLVDFGASRIKSVLINTVTGAVLDSYEEASPSSLHRSTTIDECEIPVDLYWKAFERSVSNFKQVDRIYICSEMHGFVLHGATDYISWKDQRVKIDTITQHADRFFEITGMKLRAGLPFVSMFVAKCLIVGPVRFCTLVDYLLIRGGCKNPKSNITLAASTGLVDVNNNQWSTELISLYDVPLDRLSFNEITTDINECLGIISIAGKQIPVYAGIGDLQSAMHGANFGKDLTAVVNLGTGSQVVCDINSTTETRPAVSGKPASVITHISSGRALNVLAKFVNDIAGKDIFWSKWVGISLDDVLSATPVSNINFFEAAWQWNGSTGSIGLTEHRSTLDLVLPEIARTWIQQYADAINLIDPNKECTIVGVIGGLASKSHFAVSALNAIDPNRTYQYVSSITGEETLDGLLKIATDEKP